MEEKVSVIIPVYNVEKYLVRCIDSVINQTYKNLEIILVNDGSTDKSGEICTYYSKVDKRIKVIHKRNNGVSSARNDGINIATGNYIGFVDSDDYINKDMIEIMLKNIKKTSAQIGICGYNVVSDKKIIEKSDKGEKLEKINSKKALEMIFTTNKVNGFLWNKLFCKDIFNNIRLDEDIDICEDLYLICKILKNERDICYFSGNLYNYRNSDNSVTTNINKLFLESGEVKYNNIYKKIVNLLSHDKEIVRLIELRNVKTIMESYYLVIKSKHKNKNIDDYTLKLLRENKDIYIKGKVCIKYKFIFILIYMYLSFKKAFANYGE